MINNNRQQQNGRRRGRGGQQRQGGGGNPGRDTGNRIDNRARGNAAQLHEKYKTLARDAQMQGDRVNTEYYLQFADHYFRVLAETRSRFEEANPSQRRQQADDFDGDDDYDDGDNDLPFQPQDRAPIQQQARGDDTRDRQPRDGQREGQQRDSQQRDGQQRRDGQRDTRGYEPQGEPRRNGYNAGRDNVARDDGRAMSHDAIREDPGEEAAPQDAPPRRERFRRDQPRADAPVEGLVASEGEPIAEPRPRRGRPPRRDAAPVEAAESLDIDRLPPSLVSANDAAAEAEVKPRRRRARPVTDEAGQPG